MNEHILAFGTSHSWPVYLHLKQLSATITLLVHQEKIHQKYRESYDRIIGLPRSASLDEWIEVAGALHRIKPIKAIIAYRDEYQEKAAATAYKLGIPFHSPETISLVQQKDQMRERLRRVGLDTVQSQKVRTREEIRAFTERYQFPIILKPVDGLGSVGVSSIRNVEELEQAIHWFEQWAPQSSMLVEQYIKGEEYSVEAFSERGEHYILGITKKYKEPLHCVEIGHCFPAQLDFKTQ